MEENYTEIEALTSKIYVFDTRSIIEFGKEPAQHLAEETEKVVQMLSNANESNPDDFLERLEKVMGEINKKEESKFFWWKKSREDETKKYERIGREIEEIYIGFRQYEEEQRRLQRSYQLLILSNQRAQKELKKYILAAKKGCEEILAAVNTVPKEDQATLYNAQNLLNRRIQDLQIGENLALQTIPMLEMMGYNSKNLVASIHSAFVVTLPVFKEELRRAIQQKRSRLEVDSGVIVNGIEKTRHIRETMQENQKKSLQKLEDICRKNQ